LLISFASGVSKLNGIRAGSDFPLKIADAHPSFYVRKPAGSHLRRVSFVIREVMKSSRASRSARSVQGSRWAEVVEQWRPATHFHSFSKSWLKPAIKMPRSASQRKSVQTDSVDKITKYLPDDA
jgi:hypothetical protein